MHAQLLRLCLTHCDPMDCSQSGSSVHGILQAKILERTAISTSRESCWSRDWTQVSCLPSRGFFLTSAMLLPSPIFKILLCALLSPPVTSNSLQTHGLQLARLLRLWDSPGKNTGVGCHVLLQGIFPTQWSNSGLLHWDFLPAELPILKGPFSTFQHFDFHLLSCNKAYIAIK